MVSKLPSNGSSTNWHQLDVCLSIAFPHTFLGEEGVGGYIYLQGEALNRGLFFADPPPSLLGAVSGKISEIR
jgi:hypothetical protein